MSRRGRVILGVGIVSVLLSGCSLETACLYGESGDYCKGRGSDEPLFACIDGFWIEQKGQTCGCTENQCVTNPDSKIGFMCTKKISVSCLSNNSLASCSSSTECGECLNGATMCSPDGASVRLCANGKWQAYEHCDFGCANNDCVEARPCKNEHECEDGELCLDGYCVRKCENGERTCSKDRKAMLVCKNDLWIDIECSTPKLCSDGDCSLTCKDGDAFCLSEDQSMRCENGDWVPKACGSGLSCRSGVCIGECSGSNCAEPQEPEKPAEPVCINGNKRCSADGGALERCENGNWVTEKCKDKYVCKGESCIETCAPGARRCTADGADVEVCEQGEWQKRSCGGTGCNEGVCKTKCKENEKSCSTGGDSALVCRNGEWQDDAKCGPDDVCVKGVCQCKTGSRKCAENENTVLLCNNGIWENETDCYHELCENGACNKDKCPEGLYACLTNPKYIDHCEGGKWVTSSCGDGMTCAEAKCVCASSLYTEKSGQCYVKECKDKVFQTEKACSSAGACHRNGNGEMDGCGTCVNGTVDYKSFNEFNVCINGVTQHFQCSNTSGVMLSMLRALSAAGFCENNGVTRTQCFYVEGDYKNGYYIDDGISIASYNASCTFSVQNGQLVSVGGVCVNGTVNGSKVCENGQWAAK